MKNIKFMLVAAIFAVFGMVSVNAATPQNLLDWKVADGTCSNNVCDLKLNQKAVQDLEIGAGQVVTLDLNGFEFTNFSDGTSNKGKLSAIWILSGGELTIKDTNSNGTGKVYISGDDTLPAVNNLEGGKLTIEGGIFEARKAGGDAIHNSGELTFTNGTVKTTVDGAWGLVNEGTAVINGGTFDQGNDYSVVLNAKDMTINDGTFNATGAGHNAVVSNVGKSSDAPAKLTVTGGDFNAEDNAKIFSNGLNDEGENSTIAVSGGTFSNELKAEYLADGLVMEQDEDGNFVLVTEPDEPIDDPSNDENNSTTIVNKVLDKTKLDDVPKTGSVYSALSFMKYLR